MTKTYPFRQAGVHRLLLLTLLTVMCCGIHLSFAQVTTSSMSGRVTDENGEPLIGANVVAVHQPSGTTYGTATDVDGNYRFPGMRVGGPYKVTVTYTGFADLAVDNIMLRLGEPQKRDFNMQASSVELGIVNVVAKSGVSGRNAGASTQITTEEMDALPTLNRNITDFLRLTPQGSAYEDGITFAGTNNRYNAIYIDGAVNNDVFGLASSGTNGGQTGISPFSIDIIDQFQVALSPYDVTLGGFAGAGINAVTKSGTNTFSGSAYYFFQNQDLAGKTNGTLADRLSKTDPNFQRTKLADFTQKTFGASLGGPIMKNKAFFFVNAEIQHDQTPIPFEFGTYTGSYTEQDLNNLRDTLMNKYSYDPGGFLSTSDKLDGLKLFGKIDINLSKNHRLTIRHQYTKAEQTDRTGGSSSTIYYANSGIFFPSVTNSSAIELNSRFGTKLSNNLTLGYTNVNDDRGTLGKDFPYVYIEDGNVDLVRFGTEEFSTANQLLQKIFTVTDNFKIYDGNHTFTVGTHNEFYDIYNVFIGQNYGSYRFYSLQDFYNDMPSEYDRAYSLVDNKTGDGTKAAADFNALQFGIYAQDEWAVNNKLTLTGGIRLDVPIITTDPAVDTYFNNTALPKMQAYYDIAKDVQAGKSPDGQLMLSPRVGFEYNVNEDRSFVVRGGLGIFTSRIPFVWPGAIFNNNGLTLGRVNESNITNLKFIPDINQQYTNPDFTVPSGEMDLFVKDFKYPQVFRTNLGIDKTLGDGWQVTVEGVYTDKLNDVQYTNINSDPSPKFNFTGDGGDTRPVYVNKSIDSRYSAVYVGSNTSKGYSYDLTASVSKDFSCGLNAYVAYHYGKAKSVSDATSSQNSSQWRGQVSVDGRNFPAFGYSDFSPGHRVIGSLMYKHKWTEDGGVSTSIGLFYNGQLGEAFSYVIGGSGARNINGEQGSTSRNRSLIYIPKDASDINLVNISGGLSASDQWANLNAFIESDKSLSDHRGDYAEKDGGTAPFTSLFDLAIRQDLGAKFGNNLHRIELSVDIFNLANLINKNWGNVYDFAYGDFNNYYLYNFVGFEADGTTPKFNYTGGTKLDKNAFDIAGTSSRWRMRLGVRYSFN